MSGQQLYFVGDVHAQWHQVLMQLSGAPPGDVVFLGDLELDRPWHEAVAPIAEFGHVSWFIHGNHDAPNGTGHHWLWDAAGASIHRRVQLTGCGLKLAGLGGVFRGRAWWPKIAPLAPSKTRKEVCGARPVEPNGLWSPSHADTIFAEDLTVFDGKTADILVTHEAPLPHQHGFSALNALADKLRVPLIIHGHHHKSAHYTTEEGIHVRSLGIAEVWALPSEWVK